MKQISITHDLSNIIWLCPSFAAQSTPILVCALITSCIDYCNSIFSGLPQKFLHSLHTVDRVKTKMCEIVHLTFSSFYTLVIYWTLSPIPYSLILLHHYSHYTTCSFDHHRFRVFSHVTPRLWKSQNHICNIDSLPIIKVSLSVWLCFRILVFNSFFFFYLLIYTYFDVYLLLRCPWIS